MKFNPKATYRDNTMVTDYKNCPRYFYLRHIRGWRGPGISMPLTFGLCWHEAMDAVWTGFQAHLAGKISKDELIFIAMAKWEEKWIGEGLPPIKDIGIQEIEKWEPRIPTTALQMLQNYVEKRYDILSRCEVIACEQPFAIPLYPDRDDRWYIGRMDKNIIYEGDKIVIEHKTTSEYKVDGGFKASYINSYSPNSQVEGYLFASNLYYPGTRYVYVDAALVHKKVHDAFKFIPIGLGTTAVNAWLGETQNWDQRIANDERLLEDETKDHTKPMRSFPRNTYQCVGKYGECQYRGICSAVTNPHSLDEPPLPFITDFWQPFDILGLEALNTGDE